MKIEKTNTKMAFVSTALILLLALSVAAGSISLSRSSHFGVFLPTGVLDADADVGEGVDVDVDASVGTDISNDGSKRKVDGSVVVKGRTTTTPRAIATNEKGVSVYRLEIDPEKQLTEDGQAAYKITFTDQHAKKTCVPIENVTCTAIFKQYKYKVEFDAREGVSGKFDKEEFTLEAGESIVLQLDVKTEKRGASVFAVFVKDESGVVAVGKASIIFDKDIKPVPEDTSFFVGKGFVLNKDKKIGALVDFTILSKENTLSGKAKIGDRVFKIDGKVSGTNSSINSSSSASTLYFDLVSIKTGEISGKFEGTVTQYVGFKLIEGKITGFEGQEWELTAFAKKRLYVREIEVESEESTEVEVDETVSVYSGQDEAALVAVASEQSDISAFSDTEVYIKPVKIEEKKILWIFPTTKKQIEIEVVRGEKISRERIDEDSEEVIGGYKISVGTVTESSAEIKVDKVS